jgi:hypothetical protein
MTPLLRVIQQYELYELVNLGPLAAEEGRVWCARLQRWAE